MHQRYLRILVVPIRKCLLPRLHNDAELTLYINLSQSRLRHLNRPLCQPQNLNVLEMKTVPVIRRVSIRNVRIRVLLGSPVVLTPNVKLWITVILVFVCQDMKAIRGCSALKVAFCNDRRLSFSYFYSILLYTLSFVSTLIS